MVRSLVVILLSPSALRLMPHITSRLVAPDTARHRGVLALTFCPQSRSGGIRTRACHPLMDADSWRAVKKLEPAVIRRHRDTYNRNGDEPATAVINLKPLRPRATPLCEWQLAVRGASGKNRLFASAGWMTPQELDWIRRIQSACEDA